MSVYLQSKLRVPLAELLRGLEEIAQQISPNNPNTNPNTTTNLSTKQTLKLAHDLVLHLHADRSQNVTVVNSSVANALACVISHAPLTNPTKDDGRRLLRVVSYLIQEMAGKIPTGLGGENSAVLRFVLEREGGGGMAVKNVMALETWAVCVEKGGEVACSLVPSLVAKWKECVDEGDHKKKFWTRAKPSDETDFALHTFCATLRYHSTTPTLSLPTLSPLFPATLPRSPTLRTHCLALVSALSSLSPCPENLLNSLTTTIVSAVSAAPSGSGGGSGGAVANPLSLLPTVDASTLTHLAKIHGHSLALLSPTSPSRNVSLAFLAALILPQQAPQLSGKSSAAQQQSVVPLRAFFAAIHALCEASLTKEEVLAMNESVVGKTPTTPIQQPTTTTTTGVVLSKLHGVMGAIADRIAILFTEKTSTSTVELHAACRALNALGQRYFSVWLNFHEDGAAHPLFPLAPLLVELCNTEGSIDVRFQALLGVLWMVTSENGASVFEELVLKGSLLENLRAHMISGLLQSLLLHVSQNDASLLLSCALSLCQRIVTLCPEKADTHAFLEIWTTAYKHKPTNASNNMALAVLTRCLDTLQLPLNNTNHVPIVRLQTTTLWFLGEHANRMVELAVRQNAGAPCVSLRVVVQRLFHFCTFSGWQTRRCAAKALVKIMFRSQDSIQFEIYRFLVHATSPQQDLMLGLSPVVESAVQLMHQIYLKRVELRKRPLDPQAIQQLHGVMLENISMFCDVTEQIFPLGENTAAIIAPSASIFSNPLPLAHSAPAASAPPSALHWDFEGLM